MSEKEAGIDIVPFELQFDDPYLERTFMLIADGKYETAEERLNGILDREPKCAIAHLGLLLIELGFRDVTDLSVAKEPFDDNGNYKRAVKFASDDLREYLTAAALKAMERYEAAHAYIIEEDNAEDIDEDIDEDTAEEETADTADIEEETADIEEETAPTEDAPKAAPKVAPKVAPKADKPATAPKAAPKAKPKTSKAPRAPRKPLSKKAKGIIIAAASLVLIVGVVLAIALLVPRPLPNPTTDFEYTISGDEVTIKKYVGTGTTVIIPSTIEGKPVTSIGYQAFYYCDSLESIEIPENVVSIGKYAFDGCTSLTQINFNATAMNDLSYLNQVFSWAGDGGDGIKLVIGKNVTKIPAYLFYPDYDSSYSPKITSVEFENGSVCKSIGNNAFFDCASLSSVEIPNSVTSIGDRAFQRCRSLSSVVIPESVVSIGDYAFAGCTSLSSVVIPESVVSIDYCVFSGCDSITIYCEAEKKPSGWDGFWNSSSRPVEWGHTATVCLDENADGLCDKCGRGTANQPTTPDTPEAKPATDFTYTISGDEVTITKYKGTDTTVVIPSTIEGKPVTSIGYGAFRECASLSSVEIPDSVTSIGDYAFDQCTSLRSIVIGDGVTSIGYSAFSVCPGLRSIVIPNSVTSIGAYAFNNCPNLSSIVIPESVVSIGGNAFFDCTSLQYNEYNNAYYLGNETNPYHALIKAKSTSITSCKINADTKVIAGTALSSCPSLSSIVIGNSVTSIGEGAFSYCTSLSSIVIPNSVTSIGGYAFNNCTSLTIYCEAAEIPEGWIDGWNYSNRPVEWGHTADVCLDENEDGLCDKCGRGTANQPPNPATDFTYTISGDEVTITKYKGDDTTVIIPSTIEGKPVTKIGDEAFYNCDSLSSIEIPDGVTNIGVCAFQNCNSLSSIVIPDSVTSIGDWAFYGCTSLTSIVIPDSVTSIGEWAFYNCDSLSSVVIPDGVTSIGVCAFQNCNSLTSIVIPDSVTSIGYAAFSNCPSLQYNEYDNAYYLGNETNPYYALIEAKSTSITSCEIHAGTKVIAGQAFYNRTSLTSIVIPDSVTSIGDRAFYSCDSLSSVVIGDSVTSIDNYAFSECTNLTIYCEAEQKPDGWGDFWNPDNYPVEWGYKG